VFPLVHGDACSFGRNFVSRWSVEHIRGFGLLLDCVIAHDYFGLLEVILDVVGLLGGLELKIFFCPRNH